MVIGIKNVIAKQPLNNPINCEMRSDCSCHPGQKVGRYKSSSSHDSIFNSQPERQIISERSKCCVLYKTRHCYTFHQKYRVQLLNNDVFRLPILKCMSINQCWSIYAKIWHILLGLLSLVNLYQSFVLTNENTCFSYALNLV